MCLVQPAGSFVPAFVWSSPVGANAPLVTTNSAVSGLVAMHVPAAEDRCLYLRVIDGGGSGLGTITISNLRLDVLTDAPLGPVFVRVYAGSEMSVGDSTVANGMTNLVATGGNTLAGQRVNVLVARRIASAWGGPRYFRSAWADANGTVTVMLRQPAGTVHSVRIQWPGNARFNVSASRALGAHWR